MSEAKLRQRFGDAILATVPSASPVINVRPESLLEIARFLRELGFDSLMCLSGVDTQGMKTGTPPAPVPAPGPLQVVYHLCGTATGEKIALKVTLDRAQPSVASVSSVWGVANWHEREAYDMFGIIFEGHPNLTRILCNEDWVGWPLRKDYVFPETYHGVAHRRSPSGGELADTTPPSPLPEPPRMAACRAVKDDKERGLSRDGRGGITLLPVGEKGRDEGAADRRGTPTQPCCQGGQPAARSGTTKSAASPVKGEGE